MHEQEPFADRLFKLRLRAKMTQAELGQMAGLHWNHVAQMEGGHRLPSHRTLIRLATALDVSTDVLCALTEIPEENGKRA